MFVGMGGGHNISPAILQQLGIEGPVTNTVFVSNVSAHFMDLFP